jgi:hypothetical protein
MEGEDMTIFPDETRRCVYTVLLGDYCDLNDDNIRVPGWDYICITDNPKLESKFWRIILVPGIGELRQAALKVGDEDSREDEVIPTIEQVKAAKYYKTNFFLLLNSYEVLMYLDARIKIEKDFTEYADKLGNNDILFMRHNGGRSVKNQFRVLADCGYETPQMIERIKARYAAAGYKYDNGLIGGGVLVFRNTGNTRAFFRDWWREILKFSHRDQLSANFALFQNPGLSYTYAENPIYGRKKFFRLLPRKHPRLKVVES